MKFLRSFVSVLLGGMLGGLAGVFIILTLMPDLPFSGSASPVSPRLAPSRRIDGALAVEDARRGVMAFVRPQRFERFTAAQAQAGMGVVLSSDGVVAAAVNARTVGEIKGTLLSASDRRIFETQSVEDAMKRPVIFPGTDIRLLRVLDPAGAPSLRPVEIAQFERLHPGDALFSFAKNNTVEIHRIVGIASHGISGTPVFSDEFRSLIWVDNPPSESTPVFEARGSLVGFASDQGGILPAEFFDGMLRQFLQEGKYTPATLGISYIDLGVSAVIDDTLPREGLLLQSSARAPAVAPRSPALRAGLKAGDIILSFDERRLSGGVPLPLLLRRYRPGTEVELRVLRDGKEERIKVALGG